MFFAAAALAVVAASASMALAQDVSFTGATPIQCQSSTFSYNAPEGSYYAAVVPAEDACSGAPLAEFYNVTGGTVNYLVNVAAGTQIQVYIADSNGNEFWSTPMTVGDGDSSCLDAASASASSTSVTSTSSSSSSSSSSAPSVYVAPANFASSVRTTPTPSASHSTVDDTPANAASSGASSVAVSFTFLGGALLAAAALF